MRVAARLLSQILGAERSRDVDAHGKAVAVQAVGGADVEFDATFVAHYARIARVIARVVRDRSRAEELAVDVFLKWSRHPEAKGEAAVGWLCRVAVRTGLDELRREARYRRFERLTRVFRSPPTPEEIRATDEEQRRVRTVLGRLRRRDAALLLLRADGLTYDELAATLRINPASIGTLLARAQRAFRQEYVRRYGTP